MAKGALTLCCKNDNSSYTDCTCLGTLGSTISDKFVSIRKGSYSQAMWVGNFSERCD